MESYTQDVKRMKSPFHVFGLLDREIIYCKLVLSLVNVESQTQDTKRMKSLFHVFGLLDSEI